MYFDVLYNEVLLHIALPNVMRIQGRAGYLWAEAAAAASRSRRRWRAIRREVTCRGASGFGRSALPRAALRRLFAC